MHGDALDDTCVVHKDVNLSHLLVYFFYECLHSVFVGHVAHIALHVLYASLFVVGKSALQGSLVNVVEDNGFDASLYKSLGNVEADTVRSTGNPGILTF